MQGMHIDNMLNILQSIYACDVHVGLQVTHPVCAAVYWTRPLPACHKANDSQMRSVLPFDVIKRAEKGG